ncbi:MAG: hypothetical protein AB1744_12010, partial [Candidatus Zixiibacteriota bacterium]
VLEAVGEVGYRKGFTMRFPESDDPPLAVGRYGVYNYDSVSSVCRKLAGERGYGLEKLKAGITNCLSAGTLLWQRLSGRRDH